MAIKGKTILLRPAYCKQAERKVERARDAVWRGAENEESSKKWRREGRGDGHSADDEARVRKLFHPGGKVLFKCLKKPNFDYQMNVYQKMLSIISFIPHNLNI